VVFPADSGAQAAQWEAGLLDSPRDLPLPVHPVQLYQAGHDLLLCGLVLWYLRRPTAPRGSGIPLLFFIYGLGRFCLEALRWDNPITSTGLTISQNFSVALVLVFGGTFFALLVRSGQRFAETGGKNKIHG
jgi:prolipoprotein diacylglyceryltransferase